MKRVICIIFVFSIIILNIFSQNRPLQQGNKYSNKPMQIMNFTYKSTISQVKNQLDEWGISYNSTPANNGIQIVNVTWQGIVFEWINIIFDKRSGCLAEIRCCPAQSESKDNITNSFNNIVMELPFKKTIENYSYGTQFTTYIYNGKDSSECAVLERGRNTYMDQFYFVFYFNGMIPNSYKQ